MLRLWHKAFLEERPSISLGLFRLAVAFTVGAHLLPTFFRLDDNYLHTAFKEKNLSFFPFWCLALVEKSPDTLVWAMVVVFLTSLIFFAAGLFTQLSCIVLTTLQGANRTAAAVAIPTKVGVIGTGVYRFGDNLYNEHLLSAGFSNKFGITSLGAQVNYIQYLVEGFGSKGVWNINLGGITASSHCHHKRKNEAQGHKPFHEGISKESSDLTVRGPSANGVRW